MNSRLEPKSELIADEACRLFGWPSAAVRRRILRGFPIVAFLGIGTAYARRLRSLLIPGLRPRGTRRR